MNEQTSVEYINSQESRSIDYVKIGNSAKNLVVSFASNGHDGFEQKESLMREKYKRRDFDVLYMRNRNNWYIGGMRGIGTNIQHTLAFLRKEFLRYDKIITTGFSAGGYASMLFGSLLGVSDAIVIEGQTDLNYVVDKLKSWTPETVSFSMSANGWLQKSELNRRKQECPVTWEKFYDIRAVLNADVRYHFFKRSDKDLPHPYDLVVHGDYHYDLIKDFPTVTKYPTHNPLGKLIECLDAD